MQAKRASNSSRSCCSASPTHLLSTSAPLRMKNATGRPCARLALAASARATSVLPVPAEDHGHEPCEKGQDDCPAFIESGHCAMTAAAAQHLLAQSHSRLA